MREFWHWFVRGDGYQLSSGPVTLFAIIGSTLSFWLKHNCYQHRCLRIGRVLGDDGHHRCKRHHRYEPRP